MQCKIKCCIIMNPIWYIGSCTPLWGNFIDLKMKTGSSIFCSEMKSFAAILVGLIQYIEIPLGAAFFFGFLFWILWTLTTRLNSRAAIVSKENRYHFFGSHIERSNASQSSFNIWIRKQKDARSSLYFEISGEFTLHNAIFTGACNARKCNVKSRGF